MMAPLYAELAREALAFDGAEAVLAADGALRTKLSMLIGVGDSDEMPAMLAGSEARAARDLLNMPQTGLADMPALAKLGKFSLLPLAVSGQELATGGTGEAMSWLVAASPDVIRAETFLSVSPVILQALDQAAAAGRVAETILLAHRAVGDSDLAAVNPADVARIAAALTAVGQVGPAGQFQREVVAAHLLASAHAQVMNSLPVAAVTASQQPAAGMVPAADDLSTDPTPGSSVDMATGSMPGSVTETTEAQDITTDSSNVQEGVLAPASTTAATTTQ